MIRKLYVIRAEETDPYRNLSIEQVLAEILEEDSLILYLWQNQDTVVIGRNQNAWRECRIGLLEEKGGNLARRMSGGGAVFHDLGNLNYTFLCRKEEYNIGWQEEVIHRACKMFGIHTERSGRNDLLVQGRKCSGSAFHHGSGCSIHHGTLLVDSSLEKMIRYLKPPLAKLQAKGVESVSSRVINLKQLNPDLTVSDLKEALEISCSEEYGLKPERIWESDLNTDRMRLWQEHFQSWEWIYGQRLPFSISMERRFVWGDLQLELQVESGLVKHAAVYTDAMDWTVAERISDALVGSRFEPEDLKNNLERSSLLIWEDVFLMLMQEGFR